MGKRLLLLRHAKSSWKHDLRDHDRPLNKRGRRTAPAVAQELLARGWAPDVVICSTAARAQETWARMADVFPDAVRIDESALYMGGIRQIQDAVRRLDDRYHTAWVVGHNPGWEDAAYQLCGYDGPLKTADSVSMESTLTSWREAAEAPWAFVGHLVARSVEPGD